MTLRLLLVRHGETEWNQQMRFQGQTDIPLNAKGLEQAESIARRLQHEPLQAIYSSDLQRAWQTAEVIARYHDLSPIPHADLREMSYGVWEGMTRAEIEAGEWAELFEKYRKDSLRYRPPGAEYPHEIVERAGRVLQHIREQHQPGTVCIVGHGGSLRALLCVACMPRWRPFVISGWITLHSALSSAGQTGYGFLSSTTRAICVRRKCNR